jgi:hypothetical protein
MIICMPYIKFNAAVVAMSTTSFFKKKNQGKFIYDRAQSQRIM